MDYSKVQVIIQNNRNWTSWRKLYPYLTSILLIVYFFLSLMMNGDIKPFIRRGFYCDDASLNYPFMSETIPLKLLIVLAFIAPGLVIKISDVILIRLLKDLTQPGCPRSRLFTKQRRKVSDNLEYDEENGDEEKYIEEEELISSPHDKLKRRQLIVNEDASDYEAVCSSESSQEHANSQESDDDTCNGKESTAFTRVPLDSDHEELASPKRSTRWSERSPMSEIGEFQLFMFGFCTTMLFTGLGKLTLGRFRPHFMQRCKPDVDCSSLANVNRYIQDFKCTNNQLQPRDLSYITTSWPSGHASIIFYSMIYLMIYLNSVVPVIIRISSKANERRSDPLILYAIYIVMLCIASYTAMTRVSDYHHHPLDVASGAILGTIVALAWSRSLSRNPLLRYTAANQSNH